jgi:hypothetical protein
MSPRTLMVRLNCYLAESSVMTINEIIHPFGNRINAFLELVCLKRTALYVFLRFWTGYEGRNGEGDSKLR